MQRYCPITMPLLLMIVSCPTGCASSLSTLSVWTSGGWYDEYQSGEEAAAKTDLPLLIHYTDAERSRLDRMAAALRTKPARELTGDYVRCRLYKEHEADRRYVAQFDVERAPALILVHPDGTYHARIGEMSVEDICAFLEQAEPPGRTPQINPLIPRRTVNRWLDSLPQAESEARATGKPMLLVYYRSLSRDWSRLKQLFQDERVARHLASTVSSRIAVGGWFRNRHDSPFGAVRLPAVILAYPDSPDAEILEMPVSAESVGRLILQADSAGRIAGGSATQESRANAESGRNAGRTDQRQ